MWARAGLRYLCGTERVGGACRRKGTTMYTSIDRRQVDLSRLDETTKRAQTEFFPAVQAAAGFIGFYLVADEDLFTGIFVWEDKAHADAFDPTMRAWEAVLEEMGHHVVTQNRGETVIALEPQG
jgi:hypothetical protein